MDSTNNLKMFNEMRAICTKCLKSVSIDPSLLDSSMSKYLPLKKMASALDLNSIEESNDNLEIEAPSPKMTINRSQSIANMGEKQQLKAKMKFFQTLFQSATNSSHFDHPLCSDCTKKEMYHFDESIQNLLVQHSQYISYLDLLKKDEENTDELKYNEMISLVNKKKIYIFFF